MDAANDEIVVSTPPEWMVALERRLDAARQNHLLGHELGAGSPCMKCNADCPGFELHFWRKICIRCKCKKEDHDVPPDDSAVRPLILFDKDKSRTIKNKPVLQIRTNPETRKIFPVNFSNAPKPYKPTPILSSHTFDWVPPDVSEQLAAAYMEALPYAKLPITGSEGAKNRQLQLEKQIPLYDISPEIWYKLSKEERIGFDNYLKKVRESVAGQAKVLRILPPKQYVEESVKVGNLPKPQRMRAITKKNLDLKKDLDVISFDLPERTEVTHPNARYEDILTEHTPYMSDISGPHCVLPLNEQQNSNVESSTNPIGGLTNLFITDANPHWNKDTLMGFTANNSGTSAPQYALPQNKNGTKQDEVVDEICNSLRQFLNTEQSDYLPANTNDRMSSGIPSTSTFNRVCKPWETVRSSMPVTNVSPSTSFMNYNDSFQNNNIPSHSGGHNTTPVLNNSNMPMIPQGAYSLWPQYGFDSHPNNYSPDPHRPVVPSDMNTVGLINNNIPVLENEMHILDKEVPCIQCTKMIPFGAVGIVTDRAGKNALWHPACFVCCVCEELLVDLLYFYHKNSVYCERHYAEKMRIPRCWSCDELIFVNNYTFANDHSYHLQHFCCHVCEKELAGEQFVFLDNDQLCLQCYEITFSEKCQTCQLPIKAHEQGLKFRDYHWHAIPECFKCTICEKNLVGQRFKIKDNKVYCTAVCMAHHK